MKRKMTAIALSLKLSIILFVACTVLYFTGCSERMPNASSQTKSIESSTHINDKNVNDMRTVEAVSIKEAWGNVPIIQKVYLLKPRIHYSISSSGDLISGEMSSRDIENDTTLIINNIYSNVEEKVKTVKWPIQIAEAHINSEWVVWREITGADLVSDKCEIYAYNRKTKKTKLCFKTTVDNNGNSIGGHEPKISLKDNEFLIDVVSAPNEKGLSTITSRKYNLITGKYIDIANQFALPAWGDNGYIGLGEDKETKGYSIIFNIEDGVRKPLMNKGAYIYDYATDGEAVLFTAQRFKTDTPSNEAQAKNLYLIENGNEIFLRSPTREDPDGCAWPSLSKRIAMWGSNSKIYVYDRKYKTIINLSGDDSSSPSFYTNDKYLFWLSPTKEDEKIGRGFSMVNIIDIDKLPQ